MYHNKDNDATTVGNVNVCKSFLAYRSFLRVSFMPHESSRRKRNASH